MSEQETRMRELVRRLNETSYAYYVLDDPVISDMQWDRLYDELRRLEAETGVVLEDSPTRKVGGEPLKGRDLNDIPGVSRGFVKSAAAGLADAALQNLFSPGDRVRHPKFGTGRVEEVSGSGANARARILFDKAGEKTLALSVAPIVKVEEE